MTFSELMHGQIGCHEIIEGIRSKVGYRQSNYSLKLAICSGLRELIKDEDALEECDLLLSDAIKDRDFLRKNPREETKHDPANPRCYLRPSYKFQQSSPEYWACAAHEATGCVAVFFAMKALFRTKDAAIAMRVISKIEIVFITFSLDEIDYDTE